MTAPPEEVIELVSKSGNSFHAKVARWMQGDGWHVAISPYYMDQSQSKAREIDLVAEKAWPIRDDFNRLVGDVVVRLFVECKFIPAYSVFWFADKDAKAAERLVCSVPAFSVDNIYTNKHHYLRDSPRVAKLYSTNVGKNLENDPYYRALNQVLNGMVAMRGRQLLTELKRHPRSKLVLLEFPVIVCSSFEPMFAVDFFTDTVPQQIASNFHFETQYAYVDAGGGHRTEHLLIDFIEFNQLQKFSRAITEDAEAAAYLAS